MNGYDWWHDLHGVSSEPAVATQAKPWRPGKGALVVHCDGCMTEAVSDKKNAVPWRLAASRLTSCLEGSRLVVFCMWHGVVERYTVLPPKPGEIRFCVGYGKEKQMNQGKHPLRMGDASSPGAL